MTHAIFAAIVAVGLAAPVAHASHGWPRALRVRLMRAGPAGRRGRGWRRLFGCAMCLSFWVGAPAGAAVAALTGDPLALAAPALASAIVWLAITLGGG